jgi:hypothetical protein
VPNGNVIGKPSVVGRTDGVIDIMVHGTDGHLWWNLWDHGVWGGWARIRDKNLKFDAFCPDCSAPAVVSRGPGLVDALIRGEDDQLWITSWQPSTASWSEFMPLGGVLRSSPSGTGRGGQSLDTFVSISVLEVVRVLDKAWSIEAKGLARPKARTTFRLIGSLRLRWTAEKLRFREHVWSRTRTTTGTGIEDEHVAHARAERG